MHGHTHIDMIAATHSVSLTRFRVHYIQIENRPSWPHRVLELLNGLPHYTWCIARRSTAISHNLKALMSIGVADTTESPATQGNTLCTACTRPHHSHCAGARRNRACAQRNPSTELQPRRVRMYTKRSARPRTSHMIGGGALSEQGLGMRCAVCRDIDRARCVSCT